MDKSKQAAGENTASDKYSFTHVTLIVSNGFEQTPQEMLLSIRKYTDMQQHKPQNRKHQILDSKLSHKHIAFS